MLGFFADFELKIVLCNKIYENARKLQEGKVNTSLSAHVKSRTAKYTNKKLYTSLRYMSLVLPHSFTYHQLMSPFQHIATTYWPTLLSHNRQLPG